MLLRSTRYETLAVRRQRWGSAAVGVGELTSSQAAAVLAPFHPIRARVAQALTATAAEHC